MKTLDMKKHDRSGFTLIRRSQLDANGMPIRSIPNFCMSLITKAMDTFCLIMHLISRSAMISQPDQRFRGRMVTIGFVALWKCWEQKRKLNASPVKYQFGYLGKQASWEKIDAHSNLEIGRTT